MRGAACPEELETLLEDAYVLCDDVALHRLFEGRVAFADWQSIGRYVVERRSLVRSGDVALVLGDGNVAVLHRGPDRGWRYAIVVADRRSSRAGRA